MKRYVIVKSNTETTHLSQYDSGERLALYLKDGVTLEDTYNCDTTDVKIFVSKQEALNNLSHCCGTAVFYSCNAYPYADIQEYYVEEREYDDEDVECDCIKYSNILAFAPNDFHRCILPQAVKDVFCNNELHFCIPMYINISDYKNPEYIMAYAIINSSDDNGVVVSIIDSVDAFGKDNSKSPIAVKEYFDINDEISVFDIETEVVNYYNEIEKNNNTVDNDDIEKE